MDKLLTEVKIKNNYFDFDKDSDTELIVSLYETVINGKVKQIILRLKDSDLGIEVNSNIITDFDDMENKNEKIEYIESKYDIDYVINKDLIPQWKDTYGALKYKINYLSGPVLMVGDSMFALFSNELGHAINVHYDSEIYFDKGDKVTVKARVLDTMDAIAVEEVQEMAAA